MSVAQIGTRSRTWIFPFIRRREPVGTQLVHAERIMGHMMHPLQAVVRCLKFRSEYSESHPHLSHVPYAPHELEWAASHGMVLTLHTSSPQRITRVAEGKVVWSRQVGAHLDHEICYRPDRPEWRLVLRPSDGGYERMFLELIPKSLKKKRVEIADFALSLNMLILDRLICGQVLPSPRSTASIFHEVSNGRQRERRMYLIPHELGVGCTAGSSISSNPSELLHPPMITLRPHPR